MSWPSARPYPTSAITRLPATAKWMYWPPLITKSTNNSEKGLIAVNTNDIGFLLNQSTPVMYAIKSACRTGNILVSAILIISDAVAHEVNKDIVKCNRRDSKGQVLLQ